MGRPLGAPWDVMPILTHSQRSPRQLHTDQAGKGASQQSLLRASRVPCGTAHLTHSCKGAYISSAQASQAPAASVLSSLWRAAARQHVRNTLPFEWKPKEKGGEELITPGYTGECPKHQLNSPTSPCYPAYFPRHSSSPNVCPVPTLQPAAQF